MESESFENPEVAELTNVHFVPVKVDCERHPVPNQAFMMTMQLMNEGASNWLLTAFLTPEGHPSFTSTYLPPGLQPGRPSFMQVLQALANTWEIDRQTLVAGADMMAGHLTALATTLLMDNAPKVHAAVEMITADFGLIHTGSGTTPKFPSATALDTLLVHGNVRSLELAQRNLETMARGGVYDQIGGGFHRYTVDPGWAMLRFERMLDDDAMLLGTYTRGWRHTVNHDEGLRALLERTAYGIAGFLERELCDENGAFMAGLDADSCNIHGVVFGGIHYLWLSELVTGALGEEDGDQVTRVSHVTVSDTSGEGSSTLQPRGRPDFDRLVEVLGRLLAERGRRFPSTEDRLIVTSWNFPAISSLVIGALIWNESHWLELTLDTARYMVGTHLVGGELWHSPLARQVDDSPATAGGHDALADILTAFVGATGEATWLRHAGVLCDQAVKLFGTGDGRLFDAVVGELFVRPRSLIDNVTLPGTSALVQAPRRVGLLAERSGLLGRADETAVATRATVTENPRFTDSALGNLMIADEAHRSLKPAVIVITSDGPFDELARAARWLASTGLVILIAPAGAEGFGSWLEGCGRRAVYVYRGQRYFDSVADHTELKIPLWHRA